MNFAILCLLQLGDQKIPVIKPHYGVYPLIIKFSKGRVEGRSGPGSLRTILALYNIIPARGKQKYKT